MLGLQTALPVTLSALCGSVPTGEQGPAADARDDDGEPAMDVRDVLGLLSWRPAHVARLARHQGGDQGGPIEAGAPANLCVIDPAAKWTLDEHTIASRSRNTPWLGRVLAGQVRHTVYRGEPVVVDAEARR
jgi:dihydroorotase